MGRALTDQDREAFVEGSHLRLHEVLGAHVTTGGAWFRVWAPNALAVHVLCECNDWAPDPAPMSEVGSGIWEAFVPGARSGAEYKFRITPLAGAEFDKADPFAFRAEPPPRTASVVWDLAYAWHDDAWMGARAGRDASRAPMSIYELHLGSWSHRGEQSYAALAPRIADHVERCGFTHVELLPVMEHPFYGSWGYQVTGYFAPTSRYGSPQDLMFLVDHLHQRDIGVIFDWAPSHFPDDPFALVLFDGTPLYEPADPRRARHPDWDSLAFDYDKPEVRSFLLSSAHHWLERYHADGLRVDAVASMLYLDHSRQPGEWEPNELGGRENLRAIEFLRELNDSVAREFPGVVTFAEESTAFPNVSRPPSRGGLGFGAKWDMGWAHDTLRYMGRDPIYRSHHQNELTFRSLYAFSENFVLPLSHDDVTPAKGSLVERQAGDRWQQLAGVRLLYGYQHALPGKKLLFMGDEFAQVRPWDHDAELDWAVLDQPEHAGVLRLVADLNALHRAEPSLHELDWDPAGFVWVEADDARNSVLAFLRRSHGERPVLVAANFTPTPRFDYRLGVPLKGGWTELLNSDADVYGGSGVGNLGRVVADYVPWHGYEFSVSVSLPPLGVIFLAPSRSGPPSLGT